MEFIQKSLVAMLGGQADGNAHLGFRYGIVKQIPGTYCAFFDGYGTGWDRRKISIARIKGNFQGHRLRHAVSRPSASIADLSVHSAVNGCLYVSVSRLGSLLLNYSLWPGGPGQLSTPTIGRANSNADRQRSVSAS